jgi:hypothetical protein
MISKRESSQHPFYALITGAVKAIAAEGAEAASGGAVTAQTL